MTNLWDCEFIIQLPALQPLCGKGNFGRTEDYSEDGHSTTAAVRNV